jgi:hypothetical protein
LRRSWSESDVDTIQLHPPHPPPPPPQPPASPPLFIACEAA